MHLVARRYDTGRPIRLEMDQGKISRVFAVSEAEWESAGSQWVCPSLIDLQINGFRGQEFSSPRLTPEHVAEIVAAQLPYGVGCILPTVTTQATEVLLHAMQTIASACEQWPEVAACVAGIHLEGPYISPIDGPRGAHPLQFCQPPSWSHFQQLQAASGNRIRLVTLSPEYDEAPEFITQATASGVIVAIGHTAATHEQIQAAVEAGARLSTHLGNGAHGTIRRHPNYIWSQLAEDRLTASLIADGHHLPPEVLKVFVRAKSLSRCVLVSDLSGLAGLPPGEYESLGGRVEILEEGPIVVAGQRQYLAGAGLPLLDGIRLLSHHAEIPLEAAIQLATLNPARLLGLPENTLRPGDPADLLVYELDLDAQAKTPANLKVHRVLVAGVQRFPIVTT